MIQTKEERRRGSTDYDYSYAVCVQCSNYYGGRDRMVVGFTTTYAISAYHH